MGRKTRDIVHDGCMTPEEEQAVSEGMPMYDSRNIGVRVDWVLGLPVERRWRYSRFWRPKERKYFVKKMRLLESYERRDFPIGGESVEALEIEDFSEYPGLEEDGE